LQAQLEEERKKREALEAIVEAQRLQAERAERLREQQIADWSTWMKNMAAQMGQTPPPMTFAPAIPPATFSPVSQLETKTYQFCFEVS